MTNHEKLVHTSGMPHGECVACGITHARAMDNGGTLVVQRNAAQRVGFAAGMVVTVTFSSAIVVLAALGCWWLIEQLYGAI